MTMKDLFRTGLCTAALLGLLAAFPGGALAQSSPLQKEIAKQDSIYRAMGDQRDEGYTVDRTLADYLHALGAGFGLALTELRPQDRWLDIGAGRGFAMLDYHDRNFPKVKAGTVAMSIEDRRTPRWQQAASAHGADKIRYLVDKRLSEYSAEELGRFQLITDVLGGFSYSTNLSLFMEKALGLLEVNGNFFGVLQDVHLEIGGNRPHYEGSPYLTEITTADGSELKVCAWLKRIACVEVTCGQMARWTPPVETYQVRKVCNEVAVPALEPVRYTAGTPPERRFRLKAPVKIEAGQLGR